MVLRISPPPPDLALEFRREGAGFAKRTLFPVLGRSPVRFGKANVPMSKKRNAQQRNFQGALIRHALLRTIKKNKEETAIRRHTTKHYQALLGTTRHY